jgi:hypothetical protein
MSQPPEESWKRLEAKFETLDKDQQEALAKDVGGELLAQGKVAFQQARHRRILISNPEGEILLNVTLTQAIIALIVILLFLPGISWVLLIGAGLWGISKRLQIQLAREILKNEERLSDGDTLLLDDESAAPAQSKAKR